MRPRFTFPLFSLRAFALLACVLAASAGTAPADAAESFACGPGGKANAKTGKCDCPAGKVEKTVGSTSKCTDVAVVPKVTATPTATVVPKPTATTALVKPGKCPAGMAFIPGGTFTQAGVPQTLTGFCMDVNEVTVGAYAACAVSGSCIPAWKTCVYPLWTEAQLTGCATTCNTGKADKLNHPQNCVDWNQAATYCAAMGKRLPEHAEWEWTARGEAKAHTYPWGNDEPNGQLCWSGLTTQPTTCPVGAYPSGDNPQGIHDLAGNLQEWTSTPWPSADPLRITKGGTWAATDGKPLAAKNVNADPPLNRHNALGFRCAKTL